MSLPDLSATPCLRMAFYDGFSPEVRRAMREAPHPPSDVLVKLWLDTRGATEAEVIARIHAYQPDEF